MILFDYHTHHVRCGHAEGSMEDVIQVAIERGLTQIGLSDHAPILHLEGDQPLPRIAMARSEFPAYVHEMMELREKYSERIDVRLGVEADFIRPTDKVDAFLAPYSLDFRIGSVHWIGSWSIFSQTLPKGRTAEEVYLEYLQAHRELAVSGVYDIVGHLDALKERGHLPTKEITRELEETVRVIAESGIAIEINTSGWRKNAAEPYPRPDLLRLCADYEIPVTLGSDAHKPGQVAFEFERALELLKNAGVKYLATFKNRERTLIPIGDVQVA